MSIIYKYELNLFGHTTVKIPTTAKVISAAEQNGQVCIWAELDANSSNHNREFLTIGTGSAIDSFDKWKFVDTVFTDQFVIHVYEEKMI